MHWSKYSEMWIDKSFQEYIEFVRKGEKAEAVKYARKHLSTDQPEYLDLVKHVSNFFDM